MTFYYNLQSSDLKDIIAQEVEDSIFGEVEMQVSADITVNVRIIPDNQIWDITYRQTQLNLRPIMNQYFDKIRGINL